MPRTADMDQRLMPVVLGLDVGGTTIKGGVVDAGGSVDDERRWSTRREGGPAAAVAAAEAAAAELAAAHPEAVALGMGVPGHVDARRGVARRSTTLGWRDVPFGPRLEDRLGLPVTLVNDVRAGGVAEHRVGAGRGADDVLFVALGTGIAAAAFSGGRLLEGATGAAGELGHMVVEPGGRACLCGRHGCLETVASGRALIEHDPDGAAGVARRAAAGEAAAVAVWHAAVAALATALEAASALLDPARIVLGGGIARSGALLLDPLGDELARRRVEAPVPELTLARHGDMAGCVGAGLVAWDGAGGLASSRTGKG